MYISNEELLKELLETKKMLKQLLKREAEFSIEEISLSKAQKLLHLGRNFILEEVKRGRLNARTYRSNKKLRYRFRLAEIKRYQTVGKWKPEDTFSEDSPDIKEIFEAAKRKVYGEMA